MYTNEYLLKKLHEATKLLGHSVAHREMRTLKGFPGDTIYATRFGSWNKAKKLAKLPTSIRSTTESAKRAWVTRYARYTYEYKRKNNCAPFKLRFKVFHRDNFTCQYCGRTPQYGAVLQADHIIPSSKGGKTVLSNLTTSCFECNIGKKDVLLNNEKKGAK